MVVMIMDVPLLLILRRLLSSILNESSFPFLLLDGVSGSSSEEPETVENGSLDSSFQSNLLDQVRLTNSILTGVVLFLGVIVGCICMKLFFERFHK